MCTISNMVHIWGAKVRKLVTYYGASNMAGGKLHNVNLQILTSTELSVTILHLMMPYSACACACVCQYLLILFCKRGRLQ